MHFLRFLPGRYRVTTLAALGCALALAAAEPLRPQAAWGITPRPADPLLSRLAPPECLVYVQNFGVTAPDPQSTNNTERLAAEPEVQAFVKALDQTIGLGIRQAVLQGGSSSETDAAQAEAIYQWFKFVASRPAMAYLADLELDTNGNPIDVDAGLVCQVEGRVEDVRQLVLQLQSELPAEAIRSLQLSGIPLTEIRPGPNAPPVYWLIDQSYLMVTVGTDSMQRLLDRRQKEAPTWLVETQQRLAVPRPWGIFYADFSQLEKLVQRADSAELHTAWSALGCDDLTVAEFSTGLDAKGCLTKIQLGLQAYEGVFGALPERPLKAEDLQHIPQTAQMAIVSRLDAERTLNTILQIARALDPRAAGQIEMALAQVAQTTGIRIREDLLQALGDTVAIYQRPGGLVVLPEIVVQVNARDAVKLRATNTKLIALAKQTLAARQDGPPIEIAQTTVGTVRANYIRGLPMAITWAITDDALVVATSTQSLKSHLAGNETDQTLAQVPEVAELLAQQPGPLLLSYNDAQARLRASYPSLQLMVNIVGGQLSQHGVTFDASTLPRLETIAPYFEPSTTSLYRTEQGLQFVSRETFPQTSVSAVGAPTMVALLLPAVQAARAAARRNQSINNMRQINLALLNYESAFKRLPPAAVPLENAGDDRVGLSWRVQLLPYLDQDALYKEFRLDEPWDSEHNKQLIEKMPDIYRSPVSSAAPGRTTYLAVRGERSVLQLDPEGTRISQVTDGTSNTIWLVEVNDPQAVVWTKPDDYQWNPQNPTQGLGGAHANIFLAGFLDGSVRAIGSTIDRELLKAMYTRDGREEVHLDRLNE